MMTIMIHMYRVGYNPDEHTNESPDAHASHSHVHLGRQ